MKIYTTPALSPNSRPKQAGKRTKGRLASQGSPGNCR